MPRDYRKRTGSRSSKSAPSSSFGWVVFGVLIGLFLAIMLYWKMISPKHEHVAPSVKATTKAHSVESSAKKAESSKPSVSTVATPEFDFYTVLPKMQVAPTNGTPSPSSPPPPRPPAVPATAIAPSASAVAAPTRELVPVAATAPASVEKPAVTVTPVAAPPASPVPPVPAVAENTPPAEPHKATASIPPVKATASVPAAVTETKAPTVKNTAPINYLLQMASLKSYAEADRLKAELTIMGFDVYIQPYTVKGQVYNRVVMGPYPSKPAALRQQAQMRKDHVTSVLIKAP